MTSPFRAGARSGFSLVELLVVIATIALLSGILLPALSKSKERAWAISCLNNQKQLVLAFGMYSHDNSDVMPPSFYQGVAQWGGGYWPGPQQEITSSTTVSTAINRVEAALKKGPLWSYSPAFASYHCPADRRYRQRQTGQHWAYDSYSKVDGMNGGLWTIPPIQKLAMVPEPAQTLAFMEEADSRNYNLGTWVINVESREWVDSVAVFHGNLSSVSMADGHVEAHKWLEASTLRAAAAAQNNLDTPFYWLKSTPRDRDFEWVERRYKYAQWPRSQP